MYCATCSWLIESTLGAQGGIETANINPVTHRLRVRWKLGRNSLGRILGSLAELGYEPQPLAPETTTRPEVAEQRSALKRLLVASLGMMQAMMFAVGLYAGDFQGIEPDMQLFLRLVSFVVTTPVVFYAARPFFAGAWRGIRRRREPWRSRAAPRQARFRRCSCLSSVSLYFHRSGRVRDLAGRHRVPPVDQPVA